MKLTKDTINKIYEHSLKEYPDECCGIITASGDNQAIHLCENIQNRLHSEDPVRFPRDARTAYFIDREELDRVIAYAKEKKQDILAFYHSHPEHEAYFSEDDFAAQTVFGEPEFPDALQIVISVMSRKIHAVKCFKWDREQQIFSVLQNCV